MAWWSACQTGHASDPPAEYVAHLASVRDRLPPDLLATAESVSLADARRRELHLLSAEATLTLCLESYSGDERFRLTYSGVPRFQSTAVPEVGLGGPAG